MTIARGSVSFGVPTESVEPTTVVEEPTEPSWAFDVFKIATMGWVVRSPRVADLEGYLYRHIVAVYGSGPRAEEAARHLAAQLNHPTL